MRREYVGKAPKTYLVNALLATSGAGTTFDVVDGTGYPTGAAGPFVIAIDRATDSEEKILCSARSANTFTIQERGYDDTFAVDHSAEAPLWHVLDSNTIDEANAHVNDDGRDDHSQYLTTARHNSLDATSHTSGTAPNGRVLTANGSGGASWSPLPPGVPTGIISPYGGATAPSGWLLCNGAAVSRTTYADLFNIIGTAYGAGDGSTTFNLPNLQQRFPLGKAGAGTGSVLGSAGGAIDHGHAITTNSSSGLAGAHGHSASSSSGLAGAHGHSGSGSSGNTTVGGSVNIGNSTTYSINRSLGNYGSNHAGAHGHNAGFSGNAHAHNIAVSVGNVGDHSHNVGTSVGNVGDHSHNVSSSSSAGANNPPFQVVNFVIKV